MRREVEVDGPGVVRGPEGMGHRPDMLKAREHH